ncbi:hypothetical protein HY991_05660 [Candidatus Micrarchaeota archaeon]|nr:hypothetical protein [Candidatus Micrarchaeota archaeon]
MNMAEYPYVRETTVFSDADDTLLAQETRWDYLRTHLILWKDSIRFKWYSIILAIVGMVFLTILPAVSVLAFAGVFYYYVLRIQRFTRLSKSVRKVIVGH